MVGVLRHFHSYYWVSSLRAIPAPQALALPTGSQDSACVAFSHWLCQCSVISLVKRETCVEGNRESVNSERQVSGPVLHLRHSTEIMEQPHAIEGTLTILWLT